MEEETSFANQMDSGADTLSVMVSRFYTQIHPFEAEGQKYIPGDPVPTL